MKTLIGFLCIVLLFSCTGKETGRDAGEETEATPQRKELLQIDETGPFRGVYPDMTWIGYYHGDTKQLLPPGLDDGIRGYGIIQPTGMRHGNKVSLFEPVFTFEIKDIEIDAMGFQFVKGLPEVTFTDGSKSNSLILIMGGEWLIWSYYRDSNLPNYYITTNIWFEMEERIKQEGKLDHYFEVGIVDDGIKNISAWSELQETVRKEEIHYKAENMRHPFLLSTYDTYTVQLNGRYPPWAEGVAGSGIGGKINIDFTRKVPSVYILNGYVDLRRRDLYKANNRLKTVKVRSTVPAFEIEHTFPDHVGFHEIPLPDSTDSLEIEIVSVYKGNKFDDTCITKIFAPQKQLRTAEEKEADVRAALSAYIRLINR